QVVQQWAVDLGAELTAQPLYAAGVTAGGQTRDVVYAGTEAGDLVALDAGSGQVLWRRNLGRGSDGCVNNGVTGTPALDRASNRIYAVGGTGRAYALDLASGAVAPGWPGAGGGAGPGRARNGRGGGARRGEG